MTKETHTIKGLRPLRAIIRDVLNTACTLSTWGASIFYTWTNTEEILAWVYYNAGVELPLMALWAIAILVPPFTWLPYQYVLSRLMAFRKKITITADDVGYWRFFRYKKHQRNVPHSFVIVQHPWAHFEHSLHEFLQARARAKGKARWIKSYFQRSFLVCIEVMGVRHRMTALYGIRTAKHTLQMLNNKVAIVDGKKRTGKGVALNVEDEWSHESGELF